MNYHNIDTEEMLSEFVERLNKCTHYEQYMLFQNIFPTSIYSMTPKGLKRKGNIYYNTWVTQVGRWAMFITTKINLKNPIENPDMGTGLHEKFYFHLQPDDNSGISQST